MTAWVWSLHTKYTQAPYSGEDYVCRLGFFTPLVSTASAYRWTDLYSSRVVTYLWWEVWCEAIKVWQMKYCCSCKHTRAENIKRRLQSAKANFKNAAFKMSKTFSQIQFGKIKKQKNQEIHIRVFLYNCCMFWSINGTSCCQQLCSQSWFQNGQLRVKILSLAWNKQPSVWTMMNIDMKPVWNGERLLLTAPSACVFSAVCRIRSSCATGRLSPPQIYVAKSNADVLLNFNCW